jgi:hypothetical protein
VRIWTLHPRYLDPQGLVALWRETLLAQKVLRGLTRGYRHHPQLARFREHPDPVAAVAAYLREVHAEAARRGYSFAAAKIHPAGDVPPLTATDGQLRHEWEHLLNKLRVRHPALCEAHRQVENPEPHPLFRIVPGPVEGWERL